MLWVNPDTKLIGELDIRPQWRGFSDHAPLLFKCDVEAEKTNRPTIPRGSKASGAFVQSIRVGLNELPYEPYESREDVVHYAQWIAGVFEIGWERNAKKPNLSKRSKSWWNAECTKKAKELRHLRMCLKEV